MKKIYIILSLMCIVAVAHAQEAEPDLSEKKQQDIQALKVAFITKELELTPDEAQKFWPVYNQYEKEVGEASKNTPDVIAKEQKVLDVKKKYQGHFGKILGPQRVNRMYGVEGRFNKLLIKAFQRQQMKRTLRNNRPLRNQ
ncbi:MAG: hypothetical protein IPP72_12480 [Chitinophagaceae bacterium]|nr:hypothetical protein [Chitinophagaceae bacterium]